MVCQKGLSTETMKKHKNWRKNLKLAKLKVFIKNLKIPFLKPNFAVILIKSKNKKNQKRNLKKI